MTDVAIEHSNDNIDNINNNSRGDMRYASTGLQ